MTAVEPHGAVVPDEVFCDRSHLRPHWITMLRTLTSSIALLAMGVALSGFIVHTEPRRARTTRTV